MTTTRAPRREAAGRWYAAGDVNAFFGLAVDNLTNLVVLAGLLVGVFGFPTAGSWRRPRFSPWRVSETFAG